jgi:predicted nuclease with TOPRIM domain
VKKIKEMEDEIARLKDENARLKDDKERLKDDKARLEEGNVLDICYILDKMNTFDQSLKEHDVKGIIKYRGV